MTQYSPLADDFYNLGSNPLIKSQASLGAGDELGFFDYATDIALGLPRGILGGLSDAADLVAMPFGVDVADRFGLMEDAQTTAGGISEGIANFMTGFIPGLGVASKLGKLGKVGSLVSKIDEVADGARMAGNLTKYKAIKGVQAFAKGSVAGAVADFTVFDGHEARLSNLLRDYGGLRDPLTEYLAADQGDGEIEGRLKNAIEGLAIGGLTEGLFNSIRMFKAGYTAKAAGMDADSAVSIEAGKIRLEQRDQLKQSFNLTDEEADVTNTLIDRMGLDRSKLGVASGDEAKEAFEQAGGEASEQTAKGSTRGFAAFADDGKAVIGGLKSPDVSTAVHEIAHVGRRQLFDKSLPTEVRMGISDTDIDTVNAWAGAKDGSWSVEAEEKFANGFMKYLREGEAPEGLTGTFERISDWMRNLYRDLRGSELDIEINPEVREVFDKLVTRGPGYDRAAAAASGSPSLLRSTTPPSPGLGKPSGSREIPTPRGQSPYKPVNLERFSTNDEVNRTVEQFIEEEPLASTLDAYTPETQRQLVADAEADYQQIARIAGETDPLDFQRFLNKDEFSADMLLRARRNLQGLQKFAASVSFRMTELAKKGSAATPQDMYEFLAGQRAAAVSIQTLKERKREVARMLGSFRIPARPDKSVSLLPPLPGTGKPAPIPEVKPAPIPEVKPAADTPDVAKVTPEMDEATRAKLMMDEITKAGGEDAVRARMAKFLAAPDSESVLALARGYRSGNALVEYWMNSILSGPVTHAVNISSNMITALYLPAERALGASLRMDFTTAGNAFRQYIHMYQQSADAWRMAKMAFKMDDNILESVGTVEKSGQVRAISAKNFGKDENSLGGTALNYMGSFFNLPTRFLTAEDEFFKQLNYRSNFMTELHIEGMSRFGGDAQKAAKWARDTFDRVVTDGQLYAEGNVLKKAYAEADRQIAAKALDPDDRMDFVMKFMGDEANWDPALGALSQRALEKARYATFSTPLTKDPTAPLPTRLAARVQDMANNHPMLRFAFPFIRTPTNLLNFTLERTIGPSFLNTRQAFGEYSKMLQHQDASVRADAMGRLAISASAAFLVGTAAMSGMITGGGPKNKGERDMKIQAGWQPYSIRVGDRYYSYKREDPFASIMGIIADIAEGYKYMDERSIDGLDKAMNTVVLAIARNITNKTYLTGITNIANATSNPEQFGQNLVNQYVSSLVPFSSAMSQSTSTIANDPVMREVRSMVDAVQAKIPFLAENVAPQRNILGEVVTRPTALGPDILSPMVYTEVKDDLILQEFNMLGHGFTPPKPQRGALDLTQFKTRGGQQAYDRWLELHGSVRVGGRTLRDALLKEIKSRSYQQLSPLTTDDYDSPRIRQLREIISDYRDAAYKQLLKESPELDRSSRLDFANKQALRMGRSAQELFDLANR